MKNLSEQFLLELYKSCLTSRSFLEIIVKHLKFHYIPEESYKEIFQKIIEDYELLNVLPTIGSLTQHFSNDSEKHQNIRKVLVKINQASVTEQKDILLSTFEKFIVNAMFVDLYVRIGELHNDGKQEKAIELLEKQSNAISSFSIRDNYYSKVFNDYGIRRDERKSKTHMTESKVPFSIHALDYYTRGGMDKGTSTLVMARSGGGKSTALRWIGMSAARLGLRVVHFQGEGTEKEALDAYDAGWTSVDLEDIEFGNISPEKVKLIEKANKDIIASGGEIFVKASATFDDLTIEDCKDILEDIIKINGKVDLVIFDYLEIFGSKGKYFNSETGERKRREDIANKITNIATLFNVAVITATQANDIKPDKYNNPDFVMTRSDISEFKGALKPFSNFFTFNQTDDEYDNNVLRIFVDKLRKYKSKQVIRISQSLSNSRFYDSKKTINMFWYDNGNKDKK